MKSYVYPLHPAYTRQFPNASTVIIIPTFVVRGFAVRIIVTRSMYLRYSYFRLSKTRCFEPTNLYTPPPPPLYHDSMDKPSKMTVIVGSIITGLVCLLPIFIYPKTSDIFEIPKWVALGWITSLTLLFWIIRMAKTKEAVLAGSRYFISLLPMLIIYGANTVLVSKNKMEALIDPSGVSVFLFLAILLVFGGSFVTPALRLKIRWIVSSLAGILGLLALYQALGIPKLLFPAGSQYSDLLFTPIGHPLVLLTFLCTAIPSSLGLIWQAKKQSRETAFGIAVIAGIFSIIGAGATAGIWLTTATGAMPLSIGWAVLLESWKSLPQALFGFGIERYLAMFMKLRPESINQTQFWSTVFTKSATLPLHIGSVAGILGLIGYIWLMVSSWITTRKTRVDWSLRFSLLVFFLCSWITPPHISLWILLLLLLLMVETPSRRVLIVKAPGFFILAIPALCAALIIGIAGSRILKAETLASEGVIASQTGDTATSYKKTAAAIDLLPFVHQYRINMSQLSVAAAQNFYAAVSANGKNETLSQADLETITKLSDQATREAKIAINLSPDDAVTWANSARLYSSLIGAAQNADQYAVAAFRKAIALDPINPVLHLDLATLVASMNQLEEAIIETRTAISLKPDYANAYYNLANFYRLKADYNNAKAAIEQTKKFTAINAESENLVRQLEEAIDALKPNELP